MHYRRYLRIAVFWDIKFSISSWSIFQLCIPADLRRDENKILRELYCKSFAPRRVRVRYYGVNQYNKSTYIRAHCSFHNVWHRPYDPLTRNTCAILWPRREDDDDDETTDDDDDDDDCSISISWISCSLTEIWACTLSNALAIIIWNAFIIRPEYLSLPAAANCDSLTGVTKICHKELSLKGNSPNDPVW